MQLLKQIKMKKILLIIFGILLVLPLVYSADFYTAYDLNFESGQTSTVAVQGFECANTGCTDITDNKVEVYNGNAAISCWNSYTNGGLTDVAFLGCMDNAKVNGDIYSLSNGDRVVLKYNLPSTFGYINYFSAANDQYIVVIDRITNFDCNFDVCFDGTIYPIDFEKKQNVIAEIGQLNIKNVDNPNKPVQIEVPLSIDETVCSAFNFNMPNAYRPTPISGYSDFSANTQITLNITQTSNNNLLSLQTVTIPIEASTCAGLNAFSYTPDTSLQNQELSFEVGTLVVDSQVASSQRDYAKAIETVYPANLDGTCYARINNFTLSNSPSFELTTNLAQIEKGETLYAIFNSGAFKDEAVTPTTYSNKLSIDGSTISTTSHSSSQSPSKHIVNLTSTLNSLSIGEHQVKIDTTPTSSSCGVTSTTSSILNLNVLQPKTYNVTFHIMDNESNPLENANVKFSLVKANTNQANPTTSLVGNGLTDSTGQLKITNLIVGDYEYEISKQNYTSVFNDISISDNTHIFVTLPNGNSAPQINLPSNFTSYYLNPITFNIRDYVTDFNDPFNNLTITYQKLTGNFNINFDGTNFKLTSTTINSGDLRVTVTDDDGASNTDVVRINFVNNKAPTIDQFSVDFDNGDAPLNVMFNVSVSDLDGDSLTCTLNFGDNAQTTNNCNSLDGITHTYSNPGTYNAKLSLSDGTNALVERTIQIFVFERQVPSPHINQFTLASTNGVIVPTDLTLTFNVTHESNQPISCTLRINGVNTSIPCIGTYNIPNFTTLGQSSFTLIARDNQTQVLRTITKTFYDSSAQLNESIAELIVNDVVAPGEFDFTVRIIEESLLDRVVKVQPVIVCKGIKNHLDNLNNGLLNLGLISTVKKNNTDFLLKADTRDFELNVPENTNCRFDVTLYDNVDSIITISDNIRFELPQDEVGITSIRGKGTDVVNYMSNFLGNNLKVGYNSIDFIVTNNEDYGKELQVTISSRELGLNINLDENLGKDSERRVQVPIFINKETKPGIYPVRVSVMDGTDKQTRYTYIRIN